MVGTAQRDLPRCSEDRPLPPVTSACSVRQQLPVVQAGGGGARFGGAAGWGQLGSVPSSWLGGVLLSAASWDGSLTHLSQLPAVRMTATPRVLWGPPAFRVAVPQPPPPSPQHSQARFLFCQSQDPRASLPTLIR